MISSVYFFPILWTVITELMFLIGGEGEYDIQTKVCLCVKVALLKLRHHSVVCDKMVNIERVRIQHSAVPETAA